MCKNRLIRWFYVFRCTWMGLYKGVCIKTKLLRCTIYGLFLPKKFTVIMVLNVLKSCIAHLLNNELSTVEIIQYIAITLGILRHLKKQVKKHHLNDPCHRVMFIDPCTWKASVKHVYHIAPTMVICCLINASLKAVIITIRSVVV